MKVQKEHYFKIPVPAQAHLTQANDVNYKATRVLKHFLSDVATITKALKATLYMNNNTGRSSQRLLRHTYMYMYMDYGKGRAIYVRTNSIYTHSPRMCTTSPALSVSLGHHFMGIWVGSRHR